MKPYIYAIALLLLVPTMALAQTNASLQNLFKGILLFIDSILIPFLFGIAFLFFIINVIRYFVAGAGNKDAQETAKNVAVYSVAAFVFLIIFWGLVNLLVNSTGLQNCRSGTSDYILNKFRGPHLPTCPEIQDYNDTDSGYRPF